MIEYLKLLGYVFFIYLCTYSIVNRICKCIEHHVEWKYRVWSNHFDWENGRKTMKQEQSSDRKEGNSK